MLSNGEYVIDGDKVLIGVNTITFDYTIEEWIKIEDMLIVRLNLPYKVIYNENVFGISLSKGAIEWQIAKRKYSSKNCAYHGIRLFNKQLELINWCSFYLHVNPLNGEILEEGYAK
jgi:hypothetical protein